MSWLIELLSLALFGLMVWLFGSLSIAIGAAWLGAGMHFATSSQSRGPLADLLFCFSWPLWWLVEG